MLTEELGWPCAGLREPWEGSELWAEFTLGDPLSLLQPGSGNAEMTILIYPTYPFPIKDLKGSRENSDMVLAFKEPVH